jgi:hypothetical protein
MAIIRKPDYQMSSIGIASMPRMINLPRTGAPNVNIFGQQLRIPSFPGANRTARQPVFPVGQRKAGGRIRVTPREIRQVGTGQVGGRVVPGRIERQEPGTPARLERVQIPRVSDLPAGIPKTGYPIPNYEAPDAIAAPLPRIIPSDSPQGAKKKLSRLFAALCRGLRALFTIPDREDLKCL